MKQMIVLVSTIILGLVIAGLVLGFSGNAKHLASSVEGKLSTLETAITGTSIDYN